MYCFLKTFCTSTQTSEIHLRLNKHFNIKNCFFYISQKQWHFIIEINALIYFRFSFSKVQM